MGTFRFKAFISYSHRDKDWSTWIQRALEAYRVPRRLVGSEGEFGPIPRRLTPVFLDREELSSGSDLSAKVRECLDGSESLIVVCSPASAQSIWVNEEIRYFRSCGREDRIFALIVDGDPQSSSPDEQCFPSALTTDPDGTTREPLAADARKWADGKLLAKLKIISGMLGIRLDELRRRDMQRRHRLWMTSAGAAVAVALVMTVLAVVAITARNAAENRREHAEDLVGYMVGDLREKLATVGRLDILDSMGGQVTQYLETLNPDEVTDESLNHQAKVWRQLGEVSKDQGKLIEAMEAFNKSRDVLAELYRRQPGSTDRLFELGQAEFWIGYTSSELGNLEEMERGLTRYLEISNQLLALEPGSADWTMEVSYALGNMGWLEKLREDSDAGKVLEYMEASLEFNRKAVMLSPGHTDFRVALTEAHADLADAYLQVCKLGPALLNRQRNVELAEGFYTENSGDSNLKEDLAYAKNGLAKVQRYIGLVDQALGNFRESEKLLVQLSTLDPSNVNYRWQTAMRTQHIGTIYLHVGEQDRALGLMTDIAATLNQINQAGGSLSISHATQYGYFLEAYAELAFLQRDTVLAEILLQEGMQHVTNMARENPGHAQNRQLLTLMAFQHWQQKGGLPDNEIMDQLGAYLPDPEKPLSCEEAHVAAKFSMMMGDRASALEYTSLLLGKGYFKPDFVHFCRAYDLCDR